MQGWPSLPALLCECQLGSGGRLTVQAPARTLRLFLSMSPVVRLGPLQPRVPARGGQRIATGTAQPLGWAPHSPLRGARTGFWGHSASRDPLSRGWVPASFFRGVWVGQAPRSAFQRKDRPLCEAGRVGGTQRLLDWGQLWAGVQERR